MKFGRLVLDGPFLMWRLTTSEQPIYLVLWNFAISLRAQINGIIDRVPE